MSGINLDNIYVGANGRVQLSGGSSNIDFVNIVDKMIEARRIPAKNLEDKIDVNKNALTSLNTIKSLTTELKNALSTLYGAMSFDNSKDAFEAKGVYLTSSSSSGTATPAAQLVGVTASNATPEGIYELEVQSVAQRQKFSTATQNITTSADLTAVTGTGTFTLGTAKGSTTISVEAGDSMIDIRDKVNAASGTTGIRASVVKVSDTQSTLVFSSVDEGTANAVTTFEDTTGSVLSSLGVFDGGISDPENPLQLAHQSQVASDATLVVDGVTITRSSNDINDIITGASINLYDAEPGTTVRIEVERDLNAAKTAILDVVEAYNALQTFINEQTYVDPVTGEAGEDAYLVGNPTVRSIQQQLKTMVSSQAEGVTNRGPDEEDYSLLADIGISTVSPLQTDPYLKGTLELDETKLNQALLSEPQEVIELFGLKTTTDNPNVTVTGFSGKVQAGTYAFNITSTAGAITGSDVDGVAGSTETLGSNSVSATDATNANGLVLLYNGPDDATITANVTVSVGVGAQLFFGLEKLLDESDGILSQEIDKLQTQNGSYSEKVTKIDDRLAIQKDSLLTQFIKMEEALAQMKTIQQSLTEMMAASQKDQ
ncbi:flagellar filament capping protein FliD [Thalassospira sp. MCCC 1A03138]|uniref:flagellar filament capping protein FliD n=1 Tax=Thalassospira sp. MCCC 1A03138 TaxID=1470576 RepID=UPI000A1DE80E|nr:flagellar filament capping protein FliD [Thalassospira sp. MCCC 1A03138]OSQ32408.1 flagellar hook protein FliD [Thalassospira sp. MCCC 1A03138]